MPSRPSVLLIGLDSAPPRLVFDRLAHRLPTLTKLRQQGTWAELTSCDPPITIPAWACLTTGSTPGELGLYGFRERATPDAPPQLVTSATPRRAPIWRELSAQGYKTAALFIPPSYPPPGHADLEVSCFLTPDASAQYTHPPQLKSELESTLGAYQPDVSIYRDADPRQILDELHQLTTHHLQIARHIWQSHRPDVMALVEMGPDRLHHALGQHLDPTHPDHDPTSPWVERCESYYAHLDQELAKLLALTAANTHIIVVSDHGAKPLRACFAINQWLIDNGWLVLKAQPREPQRLTPDQIDWSQTKAWAEGGYVARIHLNLRDRNSQGIVDQSQRQQTIAALTNALAAVRHPTQPHPPHRIAEPSRLYPAIQGHPADLIVHLADLEWRAIGSVGRTSHFQPNNDTGADASNHDWQGIFIHTGPGVPKAGQVANKSLYDIAPLIRSICQLRMAATQFAPHAATI